MPDAHHDMIEMAFNWAHGSFGSNLAFGNWSVDPNLDRDILGERLPVDDQHRDFVLGIEFQVLRCVLFALAQIDVMDLKGAPASVRVTYGTSEQAIGE